MANQSIDMTYLIALENGGCLINMRRAAQPPAAPEPTRTSGCRRGGKATRTDVGRCIDAQNANKQRARRISEGTAGRDARDEQNARRAQDDSTPRSRKTQRRTATGRQRRSPQGRELPKGASATPSASATRRRDRAPAAYYDRLSGSSRRTISILII